MMSSDNDYKDKYEALSELVAKLRDKIEFPSETDYDNGYPWTNKDGWSLGEIVHSPEYCMNCILDLKEIKLKGNQND